MKAPVAILVTFAAGTVLFAAPAGQLQAQGQGGGPQGPPEWVSAVRRDTSRPLREMEPKPGVSTRDNFEVKQAPPSPQSTQTDQSTQTFAAGALWAAGGISFDGVGEGNPQFPYNVNHAPPDTVGEAGLTQYVQWVNPSFAIFDKATGNLLYGPAGGNTIWSGFGGDCETRNDGDPIVQYDQLADRWVMTQFSLRSGAYLQCVAVSQTSDATGAWHRYAFSYSEFPDYPKLSVWPDAYYITFNMFGTAGTTFTGGRVCAYDRAKMLNGQAATQICYQNSYASPLAADLEGKTLPPAGTPNYVLNRASTGLNLWRFRPNFASPASSTYTGPTLIPVAAYTAACSRSCIPQPDTSQRLDALGDRLMYRLGYRNLGDREALTVNHSVTTGSVTGIRWYELDITGGVPSVRQQSTYAPADGQNRWMGSIAMDHVGNIALGFSIGSATLKPSINFAGRETADMLNTLSVDNTLHAGTGSQLTTLSRWGDYSTMAIDPVDDCTFWFTSEYIKANGTFNWSTRIGSFKFSSCTTGTEPPAPALSVAAAPSSRAIAQGQSTTFDVTVTALNGYTGGGSFSVTGLPAGTTGDFAPAGYSGGSGASTLSIVTTAGTPTGSFPLTITAADAGGTPMHSTSVTLAVDPVPVADFTISASPTSRNIRRGRSGSYSVTVTPSGGFNETVTFNVTGCPSNTTCTYSPASVAGAGTSSLTVTPGSSAPKGTYTLTISGSSASSVTKTVGVTLKIQ